MIISNIVEKYYKPIYELQSNERSIKQYLRIREIDKDPNKRNQEDEDWVACVAKKINKCLNNEICLFYRDKIINKIKKHKFLVVHKYNISRKTFIAFVDKSLLSATKENHRDFFTGIRLTEPVKCFTGHHVFEASFLKFLVTDEKPKEIDCPGCVNTSIISETYEQETQLAREIEESEERYKIYRKELRRALNNSGFTPWRKVNNWNAIWYESPPILNCLVLGSNISSVILSLLQGTYIDLGLLTALSTLCAAPGLIDAYQQRNIPLLTVYAFRIASYFMLKKIHFAIVNTAFGGAQCIFQMYENQTINIARSRRWDIQERMGRSYPNPNEQSLKERCDNIVQLLRNCGFSKLKDRTSEVFNEYGRIFKDCLVSPIEKISDSLRESNLSRIWNTLFSISPEYKSKEVSEQQTKRARSAKDTWASSSAYTSAAVKIGLRDGKTLFQQCDEEYQLHQKAYARWQKAEKEEDKKWIESKTKHLKAFLRKRFIYNKNYQNEIKNETIKYGFESLYGQMMALVDSLTPHLTNGKSHSSNNAKEGLNNFKVLLNWIQEFHSHSTSISSISFKVTVNHDLICQENSQILISNTKERLKTLCNIPELKPIIELCYLEELKINLNLQSGTTKEINVERECNWGEFYAFKGNKFINVTAIRNTRAKCISTIIHEMCHFVAFVTYNNSCNPYLKEDEVVKKIFGEIKSDFKKRKLDTYPYPFSSMASYHDILWDRELIVRIPQYIVLRTLNEDGSIKHDFNAENCLEELSPSLKTLYNYYKNTFLEAVKKRI
ncbi:MAG: SprT-like domain-containing protein, partial [Silvanigrellaceae bacterium]|nr:SprT-like domain-containing protein [Silvanigrellaceae bacterium]